MRFYLEFHVINGSQTNAESYVMLEMHVIIRYTECHFRFKFNSKQIDIYFTNSVIVFEFLMFYIAKPDLGK